MEELRYVFHLAIPCKDLDETQDFYVTKLGCQLGRRDADRITLNFFDAQIICHLYPDKIDTSPQMYPRHFGINFRKREDFDALLKLVKEQNIEFFQEPIRQHEGKPAEEITFFLKDPSNNLLQFKVFLMAEMVY